MCDLENPLAASLPDIAGATYIAICETGRGRVSGVERRGKVYCVCVCACMYTCVCTCVCVRRKGIKYVLTASWPRGLNTEIVASGCQAGVAAFTGEQTARRGRERKKKRERKTSDTADVVQSDG